MSDTGGETDLPGAYLLAFDEAGRALDAQERTVNELRSRAGVLIAAAAIATSFFGARAIEDSMLTAWAWIALGSFLVVGLGVLFVLWPRHDWSFSASAVDVIATYVEPEPLPLPTIHRDLAIHRAVAYDANAAQLRQLFWVFRCALVALVIETAAWIVVLTERV
jgi:hypothetical protein